MDSFRNPFFPDFPEGSGFAAEFCISRSKEINQNLVRQLVRWNPRVKGHCERVARISVRIAKQLHMNLRSVREAELAGALHDVGKFNIKENVLDKPSFLTDDEERLIHQIPLQSASIARLLGLSKNIQRAISERHERPDGLGYPYGLSDEQISDLAKILAVADTFDSLTHDQPYRTAINYVDAIGILRSKVPYRFDPDVVDAITKICLPPVRNRLPV